MHGGGISRYCIASQRENRLAVISHLEREEEIKARDDGGNLCKCAEIASSPVHFN